MEPTEPRQPLRAGAQHQVIGVAQDDVGTERVDIAGLHAFDGTGRADRHERGRADLATWRLYGAGTSQAVGERQFEC